MMCDYSHLIRYKVLQSAQSINSNVNAVHNLLKRLPPRLAVVSIDAEWNVYKNKAGFIIGVGTIAKQVISTCTSSV